MSSEEIEDVVSSVRRLVSNELSPRRVSRDLGADRLLLTPSLRVVSELGPSALPVSPEPATDKPSDPKPGVAEAVEAEPDDAVELIEAEWEDELWVEADQSPLGEVALWAEEAEVQRAVSDDLLETLVEEESLAVETPAVTDDGRPDEAGVPDSPPSEPVAADIAAVPQGAAAPHMPAEMIDADGTPLAVLDEAALQEIVRQMIREELQGDLGERITRNVRKLVRAEINRALIARDLD